MLVKKKQGENGEVPTTALWCPDNRHIYVVRDDNRLLRDFG